VPENSILLCNVLNRRSRRSLTTGDFSFCLESIYNWIGGSTFKPASRLFMVKPLGTPSGVRTATPSPASTAAQVPERLGLVKVRRHGRSPRFSNAAERKTHGASNSTSFSSSSGSGERFQIQTIGSFPTGWAVNASPGSVNPNIRTKSSPRRSSAWSSSVERSTRTSNSIAGWARLNEARAEGRIVSAKSGERIQGERDRPRSVGRCDRPSQKVRRQPNLRDAAFVS
jgi:hypothetical protein